MSANDCSSPMADNEYPLSQQDAAFSDLYDIRSHRLKPPLDGDAAQDALGVLNAEGTKTIFEVEEASKFSVGMFLCHGISLHAGGFEDQGWLQPAYEGPDYDMRSKAVKMLRNFRGGKQDTVCRGNVLLQALVFRMFRIDNADWPDRDRPPIESHSMQITFGQASRRTSEAGTDNGGASTGKRPGEETSTSHARREPTAGDRTPGCKGVAAINSTNATSTLVVSVWPGLHYTRQIGSE